MNPQHNEDVGDAVGNWSMMMQLEIIAQGLPVPESDPHTALAWLKTTAELLKNWMVKIEGEAIRKNLDRYQRAEQLEVVEKSYGSVITRIRQEEEVVFGRQDVSEEVSNRPDEENHEEGGCHSPDTIPKQEKVTQQECIESKTEDGRDAAVIPPKCFLCQNRHFLYHCQLFKQFSPQDRLAYVRRRRLCLNCFNERHSTIRCHKSPRCLFCKLKHHGELHTALAMQH